MNSVQLVGRLAAEPERRSTRNNKVVVNLRLAVARPRRDAQADFLSIEAWESLGEACAAHLHTGREIAVDGRLDTREWQPPGAERPRQRVIVVAHAIDFLRLSAASLKPGAVRSGRSARRAVEALGEFDD
jgi:single-strand DNA-binding protein